MNNQTTIYMGSTPTLMVTLEAPEHDKVIFFLRGNKNTFLEVPNAQAVGDQFQIDLTQDDLEVLQEGVLKIQAQFIKGESSTMTHINTDITIAKSLSYEETTGDGGIEAKEISMSVSAGVSNIQVTPNYSAATRIEGDPTQPIEVSETGFIFGSAWTGGGQSFVYINGKKVSGESGGFANIQMPVTVGDVLTFQNVTQSEIYFAPYKVI